MTKGLAAEGRTDLAEASLEPDEPARRTTLRQDGDEAAELRRYQLLVEAIDDYAIFMLDPEGRVASWNPGAQRFKGYVRDEILGEHFSRFYTSEDRDADLPGRALRQAADTGRFEHEGWRVRKSGERFWAHVVIDPIRSVEGALLGFAKVTRDLTERRAAEEALRRNEEQLRLLIEGVTDYAIYLLSPDGIVTSWNSGAARIKGYARDEIVGQSFARFYTEEDQAAGLPEQALRTAREAGRFERESWRVRKDGSRFWAHVVIQPIRNGAGETVGFAKITRDVTERLEAQKALEQAREALFQSQKLEAIGQLTGGIAHDFNNLLTAVLGSLELARKRLPYDPRVSPLIENAVQGAQRGAALTQRMLAFARKQELKFEAVDLGQLVRGMMEFLRRTIGGQVEIVNELPSALPRVRTDPTQVESALLNLIVNARDAMPQGGVITLRAEVSGPPPTAGLPEGQYVRLAVRDQGTGMDAATLAKATEPFFTTKGVGKGTGLGLPMVHGLMAQSGGHLSLESAPGEGATVTLWFPLDAARVVETAGSDAVAPAAAHGAGRTILVVDDDDLVLFNTAALLEDMGHQVLTAASARAALQVVDEGRAIDLVITDYVMPEVNGGELRHRLNARRPDLPVLLVSGYADLETGGRAIVGPHLKKPFTQAQLGQAVADQLAADPPAS